jgi:hypothetical protein
VLALVLVAAGGAPPPRIGSRGVKIEVGPRAVTIAGVAMVNAAPQFAANEAPLLVEVPTTSLPEA